MSVALLNVFEDAILDNARAFLGNLPDVDWEELYGRALIFKTYHYISYGGTTCGGYVYLYREHTAGWYEWRRAWGRSWAEPGVSYERILDGQMAMKLFDGCCERIGKLPLDWDTWGWAEGDEGAAIVLMDDDHTQAHDE